jgi:hypothetical protein
MLADAAGLLLEAPAASAAHGFLDTAAAAVAAAEAPWRLAQKALRCCHPHQTLLLGVGGVLPLLMRVH